MQCYQELGLLPVQQRQWLPKDFAKAKIELKGVYFFFFFTRSFVINSNENLGAQLGPILVFKKYGN
jgi:hypothetical protein